MGAADSKLAFRRGVFRLFEERNIPASEVYWIQFWSLPEKAEDVFSLISASDIRRVRDSAPENLETLILALTSRLFALRHHPAFPDNELAPAQEALNCIRVLTRLFPFIFESDDMSDWQERFWWTKRRKRPRGMIQGTLKIKDGGHEEEEVLFDGTGGHEGDIPLVQSPISTPSEGESMERSKPLAEELLDTVLELLSFSGFTVPTASAQGADSKVTMVIWETGVGCTTPVGTTKILESNKIETLRLLLSMISNPMYLTGDQLLRHSSPFTSYLISSPDKRLVLSILCSLLNTAMKYNPAGWHLPYEHYVLSDPKKLLVTYSLQTLLVLLTHDIQPENTTPTSAPQKNMYRFYLGKLHRTDDFQFLVDGINRLLSLPIQSNASVLPGSQRSTKAHSEAMVLLWEVWKCNKRFRSFIIDTGRSLDFLIVLLYYPLEHKADASQIGLVRMSSFILQTLSAEKGFAASLNRPFEGHGALPSNVRLSNFHGTYADFMILSIYNLIATSKGNLTSLYPTFLRTLANVSPHLKGLSTSTSSKLISLFNSMSSPSFLLAKESNPALLHILLETISNTIEHQHSQNPILLYAIIRNHTKFQNLQGFDLHKAMTDLDERKREKDEKETLSRAPSDSNTPSLEISTPATPITAFSVGDEDDENEEIHEHKPLSEKARGKLPEGVEIPRRESNMSLRSVSGTLSPTLERKEFYPTDSWVATWLPYLPLMSIIQVINQLEPDISALLSSLEIPSTRPVLDHLRKAEITGLDPSNPETDTFHWTHQAIVWYKSFLWGQIFSSEMDLQGGTVGVWKDTHVKLFKVQQDKAGEGLRGMARDMSAHKVDQMARGVLERLGSVNLGKKDSSTE